MSRILLISLLGLLVAACGPSDDGTLQGYVEGNVLRLGARDGGVIESLAVAEGDVVHAGDLLFTLEANDARARVAQSEAGLAAARARLNDLLAGGREEDRRQASERLARAQAARDLARSTYERTQALAGDSNVSRQRLDADAATLRQSEASVREAQAALDLVSAAGRVDLIDAARADIAWAEAVLAETQDALAHRRISTPQAGNIERIYHYGGEIVAPGAPVIALLPPENIRIRFFIPEPRLGSVHLGDDIAVVCDGCPLGLTARVSFIATGSEFTPPEIFSLEERAKLVIMAEATPTNPAAFRPGQPVDVRFAP